MSELSAAAAATLGIPEAIVQRSAAARAEETGTTVDEVLAAWAGGGDIPAPTRAEEPAKESPAEGAASAPPTPEEQAAEPEEAPVEAAAPEPPSPAPAGLPPSGGETAAPAAVSGKPPVLVGEGDNPVAVLVGALALFVTVFLVGLVGPALPTDNPGTRSSDLAYSQTALRGQHIYRSAGCGSCHTQMVRPIVADVGLGAVTLSDSNQVLGTRRFGPDLSNVGARVSASQIEAVIDGLGGHPSLSLSPEDLNDLVTYLLQSRTLEAAPPEAPAEEVPAEEVPAEEESEDT